jgi:hypothetical protein
MDRFLAQRASDPRYRLNTHATHAPRTAVTDWYQSTSFVPAGAAVAVLESSASVVRANASATRKIDGKESGKPFSESTKKKLSDRDTSDGSDGGPCWSDYERDPSKKAGEKGSCKPKKKKKASGDD